MTPFLCPVECRGRIDEIPGIHHFLSPASLEAAENREKRQKIICRHKELNFASALSPCVVSER